MVDYQSLSISQQKGIDLVGFHVLQKVSDGLYAGLGAFAPLFKGEYGGFMAFDFTVHAQRRIWSDLFVDAGISLGGGGGGKSKQHARELSGTGGMVKTYAGVGWNFTEFSVGVQLASMKFRRSPIDATRLNLFVQMPFSYVVGPYARSAERLGASDTAPSGSSGHSGTLTVGMDNFVQIDPTGSNKSTIRLADLQYAHDLTPDVYAYASLGVGVAGLRHYNQLIGGLGYRYAATPRVKLHAQLGVGSGGWAPDTIDTGSGLLVYPKASVEYALSRNLGVSVSGGHLVAPKGTSKNYTFGAALHYRMDPQRSGDAASTPTESGWLQGYRLSIGRQTAHNLRAEGEPRSNVGLLTGQLDVLMGPRWYVPLQASVAVTSYLGYPGYGELLTGLGVQTRYQRGDRFQYFAQVLAGPNVHGLIAKGDVAMHYGLSDHLALYAALGRTLAAAPRGVNFKADYFGLGLSYRFSVPNR